MTGLRIHAGIPRDALAVAGPDAVAYLQGQLSQDVAGLAVGDSAWSWVLQPAGKVDALVRVTRTADDAVLLDVDAGAGAGLLARLSRFKLRTRADLAQVPLTATAFRGLGADEAASRLVAQLVAAEPGTAGDQPLGGPARTVRALWAGEEAADVLVDPARADLHAVASSSPDEWAAARIVAGVPVMGAELTERTIPAETGLVELTVSFTKGCYTGQELVARIDSRGGNVPRHLRGLRSSRPLDVGEELAGPEGKVVGTVTSSAVAADLGPVALAYVARSVAPGDTVTAGADAVTVVALPPVAATG